jgi:hypothetical protein
MLTIFEYILIAHVLGDFVFQNLWMAQRKGASYFSCVVHCLIYTLCMVLVVPNGLNIWWAVVAFVSHFPIDKWSLADKWLNLINGRTLKGFLDHGHEGIPDFSNVDQKYNYCILRGGFTALVYTVVDNIFHIVLLLFGLHYLKMFGIM